jgi:zinc transporter ZupT
VKDVEVPEWKKKALETRADPQAAPFGMSWNTEGTISATQAYNNEVELEEPLDHTCNVVKREPKPINYSLALSILLGDSFHNFCDGIFIGVAFMLCDNATALTIVFITLYHEVAQELADFFLLTKHAGLTVTKALAVNFLSGLSVVLGGIVVLSIGVSDLTIGVILSIASGVYLYIAASECVPRVNAVVKSNTDRLVTVLAFIVGAVPIGLTLLNHSHCEA